MTTITAPPSLQNPPAPALTPKPSHAHTLAAWLLIALGIALRLARYFHNHSIWLDESQLSLNFINQPWSHLLEPLFFNQAAPLGFLFLEKLAITLLGASELSLRLQPLLCGIASLPVAWLLFRRTFSPRGQLFALALFAFAEEPLNYASQVKQYSNDLLVCTLLLWLAVRFLQTRRGLLPLAIVGTLGIWFSHAAVFVTAATGLLLAYELLRSRLSSKPSLDLPASKPLRLLPITLLGILWLTSFGIEYMLSLRSISQSGYLIDYWEAAFPPAPLSYGDLLWYFSTIVRIPLDTLRFPGCPQFLILLFKIVAILAAWLAIDGFFLLRRRPEHRPIAALIGLTFLCLFAAAAARHYPLQGRLLLFAMPFWILLIAASAENFFTLPPSVFVYIARAAGGLVLASTLVALCFTLLHPFDEPDNRNMVQYLADHAQPGDVFYALGVSYPSVQFYLITRYPSLARSCFLLVGYEKPWLSSYRDDDVPQYLSHHHTGRVWALFSQLATDEPSLSLQRDHVVAAFSRITPELDHHATRQTEADLFNIPQP